MARISDIGNADMRALVDIPEDHVRKLAELCRRSNRPRTALIREAIAEYVARHQPDAEADAFGLWGTHGEDGVTYQRKVRAEW
jgi:predicted transcriptional regulator